MCSGLSVKPCETGCGEAKYPGSVVMSVSLASLVADNSSRACTIPVFYIYDKIIDSDTFMCEQHICWS